MVDFDSKGQTYSCENILQYYWYPILITFLKSQYFHSQFSTHAQYLPTLLAYFNLLEIALVPLLTTFISPFYSMPQMMKRS